jgi:2-keto-4-pentenoate hydratase/2-oxohepta-3-ene-1,7-dioic acid hydratase in catechol pathway
MRLITLRERTGERRLGVEFGGRALLATDFLAGGPRTIDELLAGGAAAVTRLASAAARDRIQAEGVAIEDLRLEAPIPRPGKVVAVGRNYPDHVTAEGSIPPTVPLLFAKWPTAVVGPRAEIRWDPGLTSKVDYEAELGVVIGRRTRRVEEAEALGCVLGYTCINDVSARDLQFADVQWVRGKSLDTFCPMGPVIVTADEIADPDNLTVSCRVNGVELQSASTARMFFSVARLISFCSEAFTLEPGDVIATGTPSGVGAFRQPPRYLGDGDVVTVSVEGIGDLTNTCRYDPQPLMGMSR